MQPQPTTEPSSSAPEPFGAWRAAKILLAFLGIQLVVAGIGGLRTYLRHGEGVLVEALTAGLVGTVLAGLCVLALLRRAFAGPGGDAVRAAVAWRPASRRAILGAGLMGLGLVAALGVLAALGHLKREGLGPLARAAQMGGTARVLWAALAFIAPPIEELLFRGVIYGGFSRSWGTRTAAVATTVLFVALHGTELGSFVPGWFVITALAALALRVRVVTGSLVPAIALHAGYNLGLVLVAFAR